MYISFLIVVPRVTIIVSLEESAPLGSRILSNKGSQVAHPLYLQAVHLHQYAQPPSSLRVLRVQTSLTMAKNILQKYVFV